MADGVVLNPGTGGATVDTETNAGRANAQMQRVKIVNGAIDTDGGDVTTGNGFPVALDSTNFIFSTVNSTVTQLGAGQTFTGAVESTLNQQTISILLTSDQPGVLTINQYIDAAGVHLASSWVFPVLAGVGFSRAMTANGNYAAMAFQNTGGVGTTTLDLNVAYGTLAATTQLGNGPVSINEVGGVAIPQGGAVPVAVQTPSGGLPVTTQQEQDAQSGEHPFSVMLLGDPSGDFAGVNILEQLIQDGSGFQVNAKIINLPLADANGAAILSDVKAFQVNLPVGATYLIPTDGYQSLQITTQTLAGNVTATNDLKTFSALTGVPLVLGAYVTAIAASLGYWFPCAARYIAITPTTAGTATIYLRNQPWNGSYTTSVPTAAPTVPAGTATNNVTQFAGSAVVNAGIAGMIAVGGNIPVGSVPNAYPVTAGGIDQLGLKRRILVDNFGRQQTQDVGADNQNTGELLLRILRALDIANAQRWQIAAEQGVTLENPFDQRFEDQLFNQ